MSHPCDQGFITRSSPRCSIIRALPLELREPPKRKISHEAVVPPRKSFSETRRKKDAFSCIMHAVSSYISLQASSVPVARIHGTASRRKRLYQHSALKEHARGAVAPHRNAGEKLSSHPPRNTRPWQFFLHPGKTKEMKRRRTTR